jgi:hypothetical protein
VLEVGRRYKITNPEKMRSTYGKLIFLMQDAEADLPFSIRSAQARASMRMHPAPVHH